MTHEEELIRKMGQGDRNAANELIEIFYPEILRYCLWHAPNRSLAEDVTQETFLIIGSAAVWTPYVMLGTALLEIPLFIGLAVFSIRQMKNNKKSLSNTQLSAIIV